MQIRGVCLQLFQDLLSSVQPVPVLEPWQLPGQSWVTMTPRHVCYFTEWHSYSRCLGSSTITSVLTWLCYHYGGSPVARSWRALPGAPGVSVTASRSRSAKHLACSSVSQLQACPKHPDSCDASPSLSSSLS